VLPDLAQGTGWDKVWFESCFPFPQRIQPSAAATGWWSLAPASHMVVPLTLCPLTLHGSRLSSFDIRMNVAEIVNYKTCDSAQHCQVL
jgi:hypothetical protein